MKKHGILWWLFVSWWIWIFYLPALIIKSCKKQEPKKQLQKLDTLSQADQEVLLLKNYSTTCGELNKHFARNELIEFYYKNRAVNPDNIIKCIDKCYEDIAALDILMSKV